MEYDIKAVIYHALKSYDNYAIKLSSESLNVDMFGQSELADLCSGN